MDKVPKEKEKTKKKTTYVPKTKSTSKKEVNVEVVLVKPYSLIVSLNGSNTHIPRGKYENAFVGDIIKIKI